MDRDEGAELLRWLRAPGDDDKKVVLLARLLDASRTADVLRATMREVVIELESVAEDDVP